MSTDWYYRFRATLRPELNGLSIDGILDRAPGRLGQVEFPDYPRIGDHDAYAPGMGQDTEYDGERFRGFTGVFTGEGELRVAVWCQDLERSAVDEYDDIVEDPNETGLDRLMGFLSWATVGEPGEVVGCIASEHSKYGHADPLVRCPDGRIRVIRSERNNPDMGHRGEAHIPDILPVDIIRDQHRSWGRLDCRALRDRFLTIGGAIAFPALATIDIDAR